MPAEPLGASPKGMSELAAAKINLSLRVLGRRADGYHLLDSFVAFADVGDTLHFDPDGEPGLTIVGPEGETIAAGADNLVLRAEAALAERIAGLRSGRFVLDKHLPVASGIGGGSADAAAALRLLARHNGMDGTAPELFAAAQAVGADVPVCLEGTARRMMGTGDILSEPVALPPLGILLVNARVPTPTGPVFRALGLAPDTQRSEEDGAMAAILAARSVDGLIEALRATGNDLEAPAEALVPEIGAMRAALAATLDCRLVRMSGSGSTMFGLYDSRASAETAGDVIRAVHPGWWVSPASLQ